MGRTGPCDRRMRAAEPLHPRWNQCARRCTARRAADDALDSWAMDAGPDARTAYGPTRLPTGLVLRTSGGGLFAGVHQFREGDHARVLQCRGRAAGLLQRMRSQRADAPVYGAVPRVASPCAAHGRWSPMASERMATDTRWARSSSSGFKRTTARCAGDLPPSAAAWTSAARRSRRPSTSTAAGCYSGV